MTLWEYILIISLLIVFFNYAGYAIIVYLLNRLQPARKLQTNEAFYPSVTFIVAAFNEEDCIEKKIQNSLQQQYPQDKIEFLFITDGSSDRTAEIIQKNTRIRLLHQDERKGKSAALNRAVAAANNNILIFSDANTLLNPEATLNISRHYRDDRVGGVAGEKKVVADSQSTDEVGQGEGLYWKYESFLKKIDSDFYSVVGAAGELFSLRKNLFEPVPQDVILDDFVISMRVAEQGFRIIYEPEAYAMELPSFSLQDEKKRKIRIAAGGFQAMTMLPGALKFWKHFRLTFLYLSHRVLRWTLSPLSLMLAFIANLVLLFSGNTFYQVLFCAQLIFYAMAAHAAFSGGKTPRLFKLCYYFVFMNLSVVLGFVRYIRGRQPATWEKAKRMQAAIESE